MKRAADPFKPVDDGHVHFSWHAWEGILPGSYPRVIVEAHYIACLFQGWVIGENGTADPLRVDCPECRGTSRWRCAVDDLATILEPLIVVTDDETAGSLDTFKEALEMAAAVRAAGYVKQAERRKAADQ